MNKTLATNTDVVELNEQDQRAIRAFIQWIELLHREDKLELYEYQKVTLEKLRAVAGL